MWKPSARHVGFCLGRKDSCGLRLLGATSQALFIGSVFQSQDLGFGMILIFCFCDDYDYAISGLLICPPILRGMVPIARLWY